MPLIAAYCFSLSEQQQQKLTRYIPTKKKCKALNKGLMFNTNNFMLPLKTVSTLDTSNNINKSK